MLFRKLLLIKPSSKGIKIDSIMFMTFTHTRRRQMQNNCFFSNFLNTRRQSKVFSHEHLSFWSSVAVFFGTVKNSQPQINTMSAERMSEIKDFHRHYVASSYE